MSKASTSKGYKLRPLLVDLYKLQENILLCYRPTLKHSWADRVLYLSKEYNPYKEYNHRTILDCEVIIEYDTEDVEENERLVRIVGKRLQDDEVSYSLWNSGNKSTHLHFYINHREAKNLRLLKNCLIRHYTKGLPLPDMKLAGKHMIRAEYGVHEKTGLRKTAIYKSRNYIKKHDIKEEVWNYYIREMKRVTQAKLTRNVNDLVNCEEVKLILDTVKFREYDDGRERALFMLIHLLKNSYDTKEELTSFLQSWYKYSSGRKLSDGDIRRKVSYHYNREYNIGKGYIQEFLDELQSNRIR